MRFYSHILVGIDFSSACLSAFAAAARLAARHGTPLTAVHILDPKLAGIVKEAHKASDEAVLQHVAQSVRTFLAKSKVETNAINVEVDVGHPFLCLVATCNRHGGALLVMGARGTEHGPNKIGAIAAKSVRKAPADVLLVREGMNKPFRHITACVDFSGHSARALGVAGQIAEEEQAALDCLFVDEVTPALSMAYGNLQPGLPVTPGGNAAALKKDLDLFVRPLLAFSKDLDCRSHVLQRLNIREGILEHVAESKTDLVVLGTRGMSNFHTLFLGTTAERIVTHAPCSILAVKPEGFVYPPAESAMPPPTISLA